MLASSWQQKMHVDKPLLEPRLAPVSPPTLPTPQARLQNGVSFPLPEVHPWQEKSMKLVTLGDIASEHMLCSCTSGSAQTSTSTGIMSTNAVTFKLVSVFSCGALYCITCKGKPSWSQRAKEFKGKPTSRSKQKITNNSKDYDKKVRKHKSDKYAGAKHRSPSNCKHLCSTDKVQT